MHHWMYVKVTSVSLIGQGHKCTSLEGQTPVYHLKVFWKVYHHYISERSTTTKSLKGQPHFTYLYELQSVLTLKWYQKKYLTTRLTFKLFSKSFPILKMKPSRICISFARLKPGSVYNTCWKALVALNIYKNQYSELKYLHAINIWVKGVNTTLYQVEAVIWFWTSS